MNQALLPTFQPTDMEAVRNASLEEITERAIALLCEHEPPEGYYLADSYGKDSCVIRKLAQMAGVKFDAVNNFTTIDPPELIRFGREHHPDTKIVMPAQNMWNAVASLNKTPPTRRGRWCCQLYKEHGGEGRVCIFGVRAAESKRREVLWREVLWREVLWREIAQVQGVISPIVYWTDEQLWEFIRHYKVPVCSLYGEGFKRLGCIGCPLNPQRRLVEFQRWPRYEAGWKRAIYANWERMRTAKRLDGKPYMQARFNSAGALWRWWMEENQPDVFYEECQTGQLWTNQELDYLVPADIATRDL